VLSADLNGYNTWQFNANNYQIYNMNANVHQSDLMANGFTFSTVLKISSSANAGTANGQAGGGRASFLSSSVDEGSDTDFQLLTIEQDYIHFSLPGFEAVSYNTTPVDTYMHVCGCCINAYAEVWINGVESTITAGPVFYANLECDVFGGLIANGYFPTFDDCSIAEFKLWVGIDYTNTYTTYGAPMKTKWGL
jgi:hypothetical protein